MDIHLDVDAHTTCHLHLISTCADTEDMEHLLLVDMALASGDQKCEVPIHHHHLMLSLPEGPKVVSGSGTTGHLALVGSVVQVPIFTVMPPMDNIILERNVNSAAV
jgi:hypothetical protein